MQQQVTGSQAPNSKEATEGQPPQTPPSGQQQQNLAPPSNLRPNMHTSLVQFSPKAGKSQSPLTSMLDPSKPAQSGVPMRMLQQQKQQQQQFTPAKNPACRHLSALQLRLFRRKNPSANRWSNW
eukprot:168_1